MTDEKKWGGARQGAGRKPLLIERKQRQTRASDEEWSVILPFISMLRKGEVPFSWLEKIEKYQKKRGI